MHDKNQMAQRLAELHRQFEPTISRIVRLIGEREDDPNEPVKLLEVNPDTSPSGVVPIAFGADPPAIPYPSVVVEVTCEEYAQILDTPSLLPAGWRIGQTLFATTS